MDTAVVVVDKAVVVQAVEVAPAVEAKVAPFDPSNDTTDQLVNNAMTPHVIVKNLAIVQPHLLSLDPRRNRCAAVAANQGIRKMLASANMTLMDTHWSDRTQKCMRSGKSKPGLKHHSGLSRKFKPFKPKIPTPKTSSWNFGMTARTILTMNRQASAAELSRAALSLSPTSSTEQQ